MKILYVEDELMKHSDKVLSLFDSVLTSRMKKHLKAILLKAETDSEDVRDLINRSSVVDIAISFPEALERIIKHRDDYALFIVDRNLSGDEICDYEDITAVHPNFSEDYYERFCEREGDYLLEYLINSNVDCCNCFYMLTANSDPLRNQDLLEDKFHFMKFKRENIILKGNEEKLIEIINNTDEIRLQIEHPEIFLLSDIPGSGFRRSHVQQLSNILIDLSKNPTPNREHVRGNLARLRTVVVELLEDINNIDELHFFEPGNLKERAKINALSGNRETEFIKPYCDYVYTVASETSTHPFDDEDFPTLHTLNSAILALKEVIKWIYCKTRNA